MKIFKIRNLMFKLKNFNFRINYIFYKPVNSIQHDHDVVENSSKFDENDFLRISSKKLKNARQISLSEGNLAVEEDENLFSNAFNNLNPTFNTMQQQHVLSTIELNKPC